MPASNIPSAPGLGPVLKTWEDANDEHTPYVAGEVSNSASNDSVVVGESDTLVLPANPDRKGLSIVNDSTNTVYLTLGPDPAVLGTGLPLFGKGTEWDGMIGGITWVGEIRAIANAESNVATLEVE
jgi:hypothetical protein